jgi:hypothetical protein
MAEDLGKLVQVAAVHHVVRGKCVPLMPLAA